MKASQSRTYFGISIHFSYLHHMGRGWDRLDIEAKLDTYKKGAS